MKKVLGSGLVFVLALVLGVTSISFAVALTNQEVTDLQYLREEEKIARDVYTVMCREYGSTVFCNITQSEQRHMDAVKMLLDKYRIADPVANDPIGAFNSMQGLYDDLIGLGSKSLQEAVCAGVIIEKMDICDIEEFLKHTNRTDLKKVYTNLLNGSYNHLEAFRSQPSYTAACEEYNSCPNSQ